MLFFLGLVDVLEDEEKRAFAKKLNMHRKVRELVREIGRFVEVGASLTEARIPPSRIYRLLKPMKTESVLFLMARTAQTAVKQRIALYLDRLRKVSIELSGRDLTNRGIPDGPIFRTILDGVLEAKIDGKVGSKAEEWAWAGKRWRALGEP
jgi:tRNA nucleotidyltransferase (CCA-adding enzyme)